MSVELCYRSLIFTDHHPNVVQCLSRLDFVHTGEMITTASRIPFLALPSNSTLPIPLPTSSLPPLFFLLEGVQLRRRHAKRRQDIIQLAFQIAQVGLKGTRSLLAPVCLSALEHKPSPN